MSFLDDDDVPKNKNFYREITKIARKKLRLSHQVHVGPVTHNNMNSGLNIYFLRRGKSKNNLGLYARAILDGMTGMIEFRQCGLYSRQHIEGHKDHQDCLKWFTMKRDKLKLPSLGEEFNYPSC